MFIPSLVFALKRQTRRQKSKAAELKPEQTNEGERNSRERDLLASNTIVGLIQTNVFFSKEEVGELQLVAETV